VPNKRGDGQKQVIVLMKEDFLDEIDRNLETMGFGDRAQFIRTAVMEKMETAGVSIPKILATPPSRAGKGGRPKKQKLESQPTYLNDEPASTDGSELPAKPVRYPSKKRIKEES